MFGSLIESGSHQSDIKRKSSFFIGTLAFYALLLSAVGVGSIFAYDVRLEERDDLEIVSMMHFSSQPARVEPEREQPRQSSSSESEQQYVTRPEASTLTPYTEGREEASPDTRDVAPHINVKIGRDDGKDFVPSGEFGPYIPGGSNHGTKSGGAVVIDVEGEEAPEAKTRKPETPQLKSDKPLRLTSDVISGKAIQMPVPAYPELAKRINIQGTVAVQILIDEQGRVVSAQATKGHPLLQKAASDAAYKARFSSTLLGGQPVKVSGVIFYNFVLN